MKKYQVIFVSDWDDNRANIETHQHENRTLAIEEIKTRLKIAELDPFLSVTITTDNNKEPIGYYADMDNDPSLGWEKCILIELE